ncbi:MAG: HepHag family protein [Parcubacteria group bacterium Gr01-1014_19]|nr:MAG: HepHag family protein [Parcubacteria group bacterium Gr01-1014_19]
MKVRNLANIISFSVAGLIVASVAFGWTNPGGSPPTGNGAVAVSTSGNVGIGTMSPTSKLHLIGKLRIQDGTETAGDVLTSDSSGIASWSALAKGATFDHMDTWGVKEEGKTSCKSIFTSLNSKSGLSGSGSTYVGGHARVYMATDGRWLFEATVDDCSPDSNQPAGYGLIPRTASGAAIPGYWSSKGSF